MVQDMKAELIDLNIYSNITTEILSDIHENEKKSKIEKIFSKVCFDKVTETLLTPSSLLNAEENEERKKRSDLYSFGSSLTSSSSIKMATKSTSTTTRANKYRMSNREKKIERRKFTIFFH